jgi:hypothetical protein
MIILGFRGFPMGFVGGPVGFVGVGPQCLQEARDMRRALRVPVLAGAVLAMVGVAALHAGSTQAQAEQDRLVVFEKFSRDT